jgi:hypothetical protein
MVGLIGRAAREPLPLVGRGRGGGRKVEANSPVVGPIHVYDPPITLSFAPHPHTVPHKGEGRSPARLSRRNLCRGKGGRS